MPLNTKDYLLSCDWGTSSFRLRLANIHTREVVRELLSSDGIATVYDQWVNSGQHAGDRQAFYLQRLQKQIDRLSDKMSHPLEGCPIVISGMASSSIGIKELPYALLPFSLNADKLVVDIQPATAAFPYPLWLVSGLRSGEDMMRGEETQMIGLFSSGIDYSAEMICILPGTHSKHIVVKDGMLTGFETCMTGELFQILTHHGILKNAVTAANPSLMDQQDTAAFISGIVQSGRSHLLHSLFSVRANQVFDLLPKTQNFHYLSGLLIGSELNSLKEKNISRIQLCCGSNIYPLYEKGLRQLGLFSTTLLVSPEVMDKAAVDAHLVIYEKYKLCK